MEKVHKFEIACILLYCMVSYIKGACKLGESEAEGKCFYTTDVARQLTLDFSWVYGNVNQSLDTSLTTAITNILRAKFDTFSNEVAQLDKNLKRPFCPGNDCSKILITLKNQGSGAVKAVFHVDDMFRIISESGPKVSYVLLEEYFNKGFFNLQASGDLTTDLDTSEYQLVYGYYCYSGYEIVVLGSTVSLCGECLQGMYLNSTTKLCTLCPLSTYQGGHGQTFCDSCPDGQITKQSGQTSANSCEVQVFCDPGLYVAGSFCNICPIGQYYPNRGTHTSCLPCGPGKITYAKQSTSESQCFVQCSAGYKLATNGTCSACPRGTYLDNPSIQRKCTPCPNNLTTDGTGTASSNLCHNIKCDAGFIRKGSNPGVCEPCPQGTYRTASMAICTSCGDTTRWRTDLAGATSQAQCKFYCPAGFYIKAVSSSKTCEACPQDTYKESNSYYATSCNVCPPDRPKTLTTSSGSINDCKYARCSKGQQLALGNPLVCEDCDYGFVQFIKEPISQRCFKCPEQTTTRQRGSENIADCETYCESGYQLAGDCEPCPVGYYKDNNLGVNALFGKCQLCPIDYVTPGIGTTTSGACTVRNCSIGEFITSSNQCQKCTRGTYQDKRHQYSCVNCPDQESTTTQDGSTSAADCSVYLFRTRIAFKIKFNLDWNPAYMNHNSAEYKQLSNRMIKQMNKTLSAIEAFRQGLRLVTMSQGSVSAHMIAKFNKQNANLQNDIKRVMDDALSTGTMSSQVVDGTQPLPVDNRQSNVYEYAFKQDGEPDVCPYGYFYNYGQTACEKCPIGTYQTADIGDICLNCPSGYSTISSGKFGDQASVCLLLCDAGKEVVNGVCEPCKMGSYKSSLSVFQCTSCDSGQTTQSSGSKSSSQCIAACQPGQFSNANKVCSLCKLDQYQPLPNQLECLSCPTNSKTVSPGTINQSDCKNPCEIDKPCLNGGTCKWSSAENKYSCLCNGDFEGNLCQKRIDICTKEQPCTNGGTCSVKSSGTEYSCSCQTGYSGNQCQTKDPEPAVGAPTSGNTMFIAIGASIGGVVIVGLVVLITVCYCRRSPKKTKPPLPVVMETNNTLQLNTVPKQMEITPTAPVVAPTVVAASEPIAPPPPPSIATIPKVPMGNNNVQPPATHINTIPIPARSPSTRKKQTPVFDTQRTHVHSSEPQLNVTTVSLSGGHEKISTRTVNPPEESPRVSSRRNSSPGRSRNKSPHRSRSKSPSRLRRSTIPAEETPNSMPIIANPLSEENLSPEDYPFDIPPEGMTYPNDRRALWTETTFNKPPPYSKNDPNKKKRKKSKKLKPKKVRIDTNRNEVHKLSVRSDASSNHIYMDIDEQVEYLQPSDMLSQSVPASSSGNITSVHSPLYGSR